MKQALTRFTFCTQGTLELYRTKARLDNILDLVGSLLVRMNSIIFPVVLAHKLGMRIKTTPVIFVIGENLLYVLIVLAGTSLVSFHLFLSRTLLSQHLFDRF